MRTKLTTRQLYAIIRQLHAALDQADATLDLLYAREDIAAVCRRQAALIAGAEACDDMPAVDDAPIMSGIARAMAGAGVQR